MRPGGGRRHGPVPPPRRLRHLRRPGPDGPALLAAPPADRLPRQLRLARGPARRGPLHRVPAPCAGPAHAGRHRRVHRRFRGQLLGGFLRALGAAGPPAEPAGQWQPGHRRGHGHQHPAPQPGRDHRRGGASAGPPRRRHRRPAGLHHRPRLPHRGPDPGPGRHRVGLPHRPGPGEDAGRGGGGRNRQPHRAGGHRAALSGVGRVGGPQDRGPGRQSPARRHRRRQRRVLRRRHPLRHHPQAGRQPRGGAQQPLEEDAPAVQLHREPGGLGGRRAPHAHPARRPGRLRRSPDRGGDPPVRAPLGRVPGPPPRLGGPDPSRQSHRRGDRRHPGQPGPPRGPRGSHGRAVRAHRDPGQLRARHGAGPPHPAGPGLPDRRSRPEAGPHRRAGGHPGQPGPAARGHPGRTGRDQGEVRHPPAHRLGDRPRRGGH